MLTRAEGRVLGALIEKQLTTPDIYPLTLKALTGACNQTSNRDPVMTIEPLDVETTVLVLKTKGLARVVHPGSGERSTRYRQVAEEVFGLDESERALLCVLLLRGAQTAGELRTRTERLHPFSSPEAVERALGGLADRAEPLVSQVERRAGQKEPRWTQLLEDDPYIPDGPSPGSAAVGSTAAAGARADRLADLEARVERLEAQVAGLRSALGDTDT